MLACLIKDKHIVEGVYLSGFIWLSMILTCKELLDKSELPNSKPFFIWIFQFGENMNIYVLLSLFLCFFFFVINDAMMSM